MGNEEVDLVTISKPTGKSLLEKYDIPVENLSYEFISECKDGKLLERIVLILRSGEEGIYPDLTRHAEERLALIKPKSAVLRRAEPILKRDDLAPSQQKEINEDIDGWMREMQSKERDLNEAKDRLVTEPCIPQPDIRQAKESSSAKKTTLASTSKKNENKRIESCNYAAWDKYDVDTEINRIDLRDEQRMAAIKQDQKKEEARRKSKQTAREIVIDRWATSSLSGTERSMMAEREREKGNEAFRAGDYTEALEHYDSSLKIAQTSMAFNNRAITLIKLNRFEDAVPDCNTVLSMDYNNIKALLRRALAMDHLGKRSQSLADYEAVLTLEPDNKVAIRGIKKLRKPGESRRVRMNILDDNAVSEEVRAEVLKTIATRELVNSSTTPYVGGNNERTICYCDRAPGPSQYSKPLPHYKASYCVDNRVSQKSSKGSKAPAPVKTAKNLVTEMNNPSTLAKQKSVFSFVSREPRKSGVIIEELPNDEKLTEKKVEKKNASKHASNEVNSKNNNNKSGSKSSGIEELKNNIPKMENSSEPYVTRKTCTDNTTLKNKSTSEINPDISKNIELAEKVISDTINVTSVEKDKSEIATECATSVNRVEEKILPKIGTKCTKDVNTLEEKSLSETATKCVTTPSKGILCTEELANISSPYEFIRNWHSLKATNDLRLHAQLLKSLSPENVNKVIGNKLDGTMFSIILRCLENYFNTSQDVEFLAGFLKSLSQLSRFSIVCMFMDSADKKALRSILHFLEEEGSSNVQSLRETYMV